MDDLELERILAETMQESSFGEETENLGEDLPDEVEVTVEDLVFTLRQIATAVIEVRELVEQQGSRIEELQDLLAEHHQTQHEHVSAVVDSLSETLVARQADAERKMMDQVKAMGSVLAEIATANPGGVAIASAAAVDGDDDGTAEEKKSAHDTAKQRSDDRKLTFTARLRRKMLADQEAGSKSPDSDTASKAKSPAESKTPAIRRPNESPRVPPPPKAEGKVAKAAEAGNQATGEKSGESADGAEEKPEDPEPAGPPPSSPSDQAKPKVESPPDPDAQPEADDDGPRNTGDVPIPEPVKQIQKQVFSFKLAVSQIVRSNKLPRVGTPIHNEVSSLLSEKSNEILKKSLDLHNKNLAQAQQVYESKPASGTQDPSAFWSPELIEPYRDFRTGWFIKHILDKLEVAIRKAGLDDHLLLLDELAMELELGRIAVQEGTPYDPKRHQVKEGTQKPMGGDFYNVVVNQLFKPGYVDLSTGKTIRKAIVSVKMVPR